MKNLALATILLLTSLNSYPCSCDAGSIKEKYETHTSVFEGKVIEIDFYNSEDAFGDQQIRVKFEIKNQWKGKPDQNELYTVYNGASCFGYQFKKNADYIVYAFEQNNRLDVWWCGGVVPKTNKKGFMKEQKNLNKLAEK